MQTAKQSSATTKSIEFVKRVTATVRAKLLGLPPPDPTALTPEERKLAGVYRVIHGRICIDPTTHPQLFAEVGDEIRLGDVDAANMIDAGVIEPLDTKPSRAGKVWVSPPIVRNLNAH